MTQHYEPWARARIRYFYSRFGSQIRERFEQTPFPVSMIVGVAIEETGYIWNAFEKRNLSDEQFLGLIVGDSYGFGVRTRWPTSKAQLLSETGGKDVFDAMRQALEERAALVGGHAAQYVRNPNNIMMACGPWQYDLGFVRWAGPEFFAERKWRSLEQCMAVFHKEIENRRNALRMPVRNLSRYQMALIATAYNTGATGFKPARGLNQGNRTQGRWYGQRVHDFIGYARNIIGDSYPDR
ncbi:hypothetical protein [uncultured Tateyamaria sp.]|uniref:hypothetical protein n=1 Tax=Tateyamaria sp. 1078 TaxID=3417464 RepID=UPI00262CDBF5|nr:hypothetical protein [uncultured Tateyamaria sp.]